MDKPSNVRVVGFPIEPFYSKEWLDSLTDRERSEAACADGDTYIYQDLKEFQDDILNMRNPNAMELFTGNYWYFLNN
jgi:hypothetical protein